MAAGSDGQSDEPANAESLLAGNDEVTKGTAQKYLGVSDRQIRKLIKAGKLTTVGEGQHQKVTVKSLRRRKGTKAPRKKEIRNPSEPKGTKRNS
jgi:hypothetical protein